MTSVDSGVETGNDSNDSSITGVKNRCIGKNGTDENWEESSKSTTFLAITSNSSKPTLILTEEIDQLLSSISSEDTAAVTELPATKSTNKATICTAGPLVPFNSNPLKLPARVKFHFQRERLNCAYCTRMVRDSLKARHIQSAREARRSTLFLDKNKIPESRMRIYAATNNFEGVLRLLEMGVSPNNSDARGRTPLHFASCSGYTDLVRLLLSHGADAKRQDNVGNTPLHLAVVTNKTDVINLLLEAGNDPLSSNSRGYNPLQLAETRLRLLQKFKGEDMVRVKTEVRQVVNMLMGYLQNRKGFNEQVEALNTLCSRLSLTTTNDQVQNEVKDLLSSIDSLTLN